MLVAVRKDWVCFRRSSFIIFVLLFTLIFSSSVFAYNDLDANHWAYKAVLEYEDIEDSRWSKPYIDIGGKYFTAYKMGNKYFFKPEEASLREDVIVTTVLALGLEDFEYDLDILDQFSDKDEITSSLKKYLAIAVQNDLIHGNPDGTINPKGNLTRAEVSQFMYNILVGLELEEDEEEEEVEEVEGEIIKIPIFEEVKQKMRISIL